MSSTASTFPPDYANANIGSRVTVAASMFIVLEIAAVSLRCAARLKYDAKWGTDDTLIVPALIFCLSMCAIGISESNCSSPLVTNTSLAKAIHHYAE